MRNLFKSKLNTLVILLNLSFLWNPISSVQAKEHLSLEDFLSQVKNDNPGIKGYLNSSSGGELRAEEGSLLIAPTMFANFTYIRDARVPRIAFLGFDQDVTKTFSFGIKKLTTFGLQTSLHYDILSQYYNKDVALSPLTANFVPGSYAVASPVLELTQSLWSNGFGRSTRATQDQIEAQALASSYQSRFQAKSGLTQAEISYWQLALARQTVAVQKEALDRAKKIQAWSARRAKLHLADQSDAVQADALTQSRELDLVTALNSERTASRSFNTARHIDSDVVQELLAPLDPKMIDEIRIPKRADLRDDVKAAQQNSRSAEANAIISLERDLPTLDIFASVTLNGQRGYNSFNDVSESIGPSFSLNRPSTTVGFRLSAPIDFFTMQKSREGWKLERLAAELSYEQKAFAQEQDWKELNNQFIEAKRHLELSRKLEVIQESKLKIERDRLQQGRTTTYQVLLFEQDYLLAQLGRIRDQANVLNIVAQMKLYGESL